jgi:hypothetical protein
MPAVAKNPTALAQSTGSNLTGWAIQLIKYVFVIENIFLSSGKEDERSGFKFHKNEFPATPPESCV